MSLNRRLYAWLIGTDASGASVSVTAPEIGSLERQDSEPSMKYFDQHSKAFLIQAIKRILSGDIEEDQKSNIKLRPFKILTSLLDKPEIGSAILEDIFLDVLRCIYRECVTKAGDHCSKIGLSSSQKHDDSMPGVNDVVKTANLLLSSLEPGFIWQFVGQSLDTACAGSSSNQPVPTSDSVMLLELCTIVDFMLDKLSIVCIIMFFSKLFLLFCNHDYFCFCVSRTAGFSAIKPPCDLIFSVLEDTVSI